MSIHLNRINLKGKDISSKWHLINADGKILGRLASEIARLLMGKDKPTYSTNLLSGDFVVVINSQGIRLTGNKSETKKYWRHSGYPGGIRQTRLDELLAKRPDRVIRQAVRGMMPKTALGRNALRRLRVYDGPEHLHEAQKPEEFELG